MTQQSPSPRPDGGLSDTPAQAAATTSQESAETAGTDTPRFSIADRTKGLPLRARHALQGVGQMIERRQLDEAERTLTKIRTHAGKHPEFLRMAAVVLHLRGRSAEAATLLRNALTLSPNDPLIHTNLGSVLNALDDPMGATIAFQRACELDPKLAAPWYNLGNALSKQFRVEEALSAFEEALRRDPDHATARLARAGLFLSVGRLDESAQEYRRILERRPDMAAAWTGLCTIKSARLTDEEMARLEGLYASQDTPEPTRNRLGFALGKTLEDRGRFEEAFTVLTASNASTRRSHKWDADEFTRAIGQIRETFRRPVAQASDPTLGKEVIFVVSMPRSGSTLTEQILASHSEVAGADELPTLGDVVNEEGVRRGVGYPDWLPQATPADWTRLGQEYLKRTQRWRKRHPRSTDKGLANWPFVGAIHAMLPGARIVDCRRDAVETCWSCFKHLFGRGQSYTYDISELASYWRDYDGLMRYWHALYPHRLHEIVYEKLVADPETEIRRLLDFCGLPFEPACMRFNETQRPVRTMSAGQVRQPLSADTARAAGYGELLSPLRWALGIEKVTT